MVSLASIFFEWVGSTTNWRRFGSDDFPFQLGDSEVLLVDFQGWKEAKIGGDFLVQKPFLGLFLHFAGSTQTIDESFFFDFLVQFLIKRPNPPGFLEKMKG